MSVGFDLWRPFCPSLSTWLVTGGMKIDRWKASIPVRWNAVELNPGFRSEKLANIWAVARPVMTSALGFRSTPGLEQFSSPMLPIRPVSACRHTSVTGNLWISLHITSTAVMLRITSTQRIIRNSIPVLSGRHIIPRYCSNLLQTNTMDGYFPTRQLLVAHGVKMFARYRIVYPPVCYKNVKYIILPVLLYGYETWSVTFYFHHYTVQ